MKERIEIIDKTNYFNDYWITIKFGIEKIIQLCIEIIHSIDER
jgi:hypothetical protein